MLTQHPVVVKSEGETPEDFVADVSWVNGRVYRADRVSKVPALSLRHLRGKSEDPVEMAASVALLKRSSAIRDGNAAVLAELGLDK